MSKSPALSVQKLVISRNDIGTKGIALLSNGIKELKNLTELNMNLYKYIIIISILETILEMKECYS